MAMILAISSGAFGWSSPASQTESDIRHQKLALENNLLDSRHLPKDKYWEKLGNYYDTRYKAPSGAPLDRWGQPYIYRMPGLHGPFDLYSIGKNGINDQGALDDISSWAGVNDGYYYKADWPRGRFAIGAGIIAGFLSLSLAIILPWRTVIPLAGSMVGLGIFKGCQWLMHPGIVPDRNAPLSVYSLLAAGAFVGCLIYLIRNLRNEGLVLRRRTSPEIIPQSQS